MQLTVKSSCLYQDFYLNGNLNSILNDELYGQKLKICYEDIFHINIVLDIRYGPHEMNTIDLNKSQYKIESPVSLPELLSW